MKKSLYTLLFALITAFAVSACADDDIKPRDGGGSASDPCQFGGPGCPKK